MAKLLVNLINDLIRRQNAEIAPVRNIRGVSVVGVANPTLGELSSRWITYSLPGVTRSIPLSPDSIIDQLSSLQVVSSPILNAINGVLAYNVVPGTSLTSTVVSLPQPILMPIEVVAPGRQIAIYSHESIVTRGENEVTASLSLPQGKTPINVVTQGPTPIQLAIAIPPDINTDVTSYLPPPPSWLNSGAVNPGYIDPSSGQPGIQLLWNNQSNVGGWNVYKVTTYDYGAILQESSTGGRYIIRTNFSGTSTLLYNSGTALPYIGVVGVVNNYYIGTLESVNYNSEEALSTFIFRALDNGDTILSGTLKAIGFAHTATVQKNSEYPVIQWVDLNIRKGAQYSYTIDSFGLVDPLLRSDKAQIKTVTAASIPGIQGISLIEQTPGYLTLHLIGINFQVKYWSGWLRKNNWPTIVSGSADAYLNNDFLRFSAVDSNQATFSFSAGTGWWYAVVVPYDSDNNDGLRVITSGNVTGNIGGSGGTGINTPALTSIGVDVIGGRNLLWWTHNAACERPGTGNGSINIKITAFSPDVDTMDITQPVPRYVWQEWEDTSSNIVDTTNNRTGYGSMMDMHAQVTEGAFKAQSTWYYTLALYSGTSLINTYHTQISGYYILHVPPPPFDYYNPGLFI